MATTYRGFDVLEVEPDRGASPSEEFNRKVFALDSITGKRTAVAADPAPTVIRSFRWMAFNRTEAADLRTFLDARKGRAVPCWIPAWDEDMTLTADYTAGGLTITILGMSYSAMMFPTTFARRHVAIRIPGGTTYYRKIAGAVDNGNGTETLTLEESVPVDVPASGTLISFLCFSRMEDDRVEIEWSGQFAQCEFLTHDLPTETPA